MTTPTPDMPYDHHRHEEEAGLYDAALAGAMEFVRRAAVIIAAEERRILMAENDKLRDRIRELEDRLRVYQVVPPSDSKER